MATRRRRARAAGRSSIANGRIRVPLGERSYDIVFAESFARLADEVIALGLGRRAFVLTDRQVAPHYLPPVARALGAAGLVVSGAIFPSGERVKTLGRYRQVLNLLLAAGLERTDTLVALGGGVVGDLGGFAAATYLRGIALVQLPTTLLAMVDSSIGGKVGVNLPQGKNLVGAFHAPRLVYGALSTLDTLPAREFRSGLAEVVKAGMVGDRRLFRYLETELDQILRRERQPLAHAIARAVRVKAVVVAADEREAGRRMILNYGHTIGHAIEAATGYRRFLHGEAVALGMAAAAHLGGALGITPRTVGERQNRLLARAGLPVRARALPASEIIRNVRYDKKIRDGKLRFVLTPEVGSASVREHRAEHHLRRAIEFITIS